MIRWLLVLILLPALSAVAQSRAPDLAAEFEASVLVIESAQPACFRLDVYLAVTRQERAQGLMFVRDLPEMTGMLFIYDRDAILSIWMKNTFIPLDIVFVAADGTPINTHRNAQPQTLDSRRAERPARYVLELNAGMADRLGLTSDARLLVELVEHGGD